MKDMGTYYEMLRMCPPTAITLFYTKISIKGEMIHVHNHSTVGQIRIIDNANKNIEDFMIDKKIIKGVSLTKINKIEHPRYVNQIFN